MPPQNHLYAESAEKALEIVKSTAIDLVIMDLGLPGMDGIEASRLVKSHNREIKIVVLTSHNDVQEVLNCLKAGANAYCSKEINPIRLTQVVQSVLDGASWFDPSIAHIVLEAASKSSQMPEKPLPEKDYGLTSRETQILKLITEGYSNNEISLIVSRGDDEAVSEFAKRDKVKVSDKIKNVQKNVKNNFSNFTTRKLKDILITLSNSRKKGSNRYE